jgi:TonB family protein
MTTLMQGLIQLSGHPLVHALGWTLLHFCWQGAAVALVLWCVLGLLGGRSSQARYGAACLALGLMVALPAATFAHIASAEYRARTAMLGSGVVLDASLVLQVGADEPAPPWPVRIGMALDRSLPWVLLAWFAGVIVFAGRMNFGLLVARRLKTAGTEAPPPALVQLFEDLRTRLGVDRAVELLHSAQVQVPTVIGWLRPVVLLPVSCLTGLSPEQIEAVLCHELAHVRRHDYLVSVIQSVIETILFYHPAVWWVSRQVRRERECCCDELAVAVGGDVLAYARALSFLEESRASFPEFVLGANGGVLKMRIKRILGSKRDAEGSPAAALVALAMIVAVAGSYFVAVSRAQAQAKAQAQHTEIAEAAVPLGIVSVTQEGTANPGAPAAQPAAPRGAENQPDLQQLLPETLDAERQALDLAAKISPEYRKQLEEALAAFAKVNTPEFRKQFDEAMSPELKKELEDAQRQLQDAQTKLDSEQVKKQMEDAQRQLQDAQKKLNSPEFKKQWADAMAKAASAGSPQFRKQLDDAMKALDKVNTPEYRKEMEALAAESMAMARESGGSPQSVTPPPTAGASQEAGSISGIIVDPTGALVPRAKVTTVNTDTGVMTTKVTDNAGSYSFSPVPPGPYNVEVEAKGLQRMLQENVHVGAGQSVKLNLKLTVGAANESLTVTGKPVAAAPPPPPPPPLPAMTGKPIGLPQRVSAGVMAGNLISNVVPVYPEEAKAQHVQGAVVLRARISKEGTVKDVQVISGPPPLIVSAIDAVRQWKYKPYLLNGEPTEVDTTININYTFGEAADSQLQAAPGSSQAGARNPLRVAPGLMDGNLISKVDPVYPEIAKAAHVQGIVVLHAVISKEGVVEDLSVISGAPMLTSSAIEAVKQWKYKPYLLNGQPWGVETAINVNFTLGDAASSQTPTVLVMAAQPDKDSEGRAAQEYKDMVSALRKIGGNVSSPILIYRVDPEFSAEARQAKIGGVVLVGMIVTPKGVPLNVHVVRGIGHGLDEQAVAAVKQYGFKPAMENGNPVPVELNVEVNFKIMESPEPKDAPSNPNGPSASESAPPVQSAAQQYGGVPVRKIGGGVTAPELIYKVDPEFSAEAKKAKFNGFVLVNLIVDAKGKPQDVRVLRGVGMGLDEKAVAAVKRYKFKPAMEGGKPVPVGLNVEINFKIF